MASWTDNLVVKARWSWKDWLKLTAIMTYWFAVAVVGVLDIVMFLMLWVNGFNPPNIQSPLAP